MSAARRRAAVLVALVLMPLAVYWQVLDHEFVLFDDPEYVHDNPHVTSGLTARNAAWAFKTTEQANWHPLVWLSLMLDSEVHGTDAGGFLLTNILLHVANGLLLFAALSRMTGEAGKSGFVAALFALHPLHVESVAWVASRKDVLSTLFGLLALIAWIAFVRHRRSACYLLALLAFACSLMSKQMLVTLPFVFLLLDYWPLGRWTPSASRPRLAGLGPLVLEKVPFFVLGLAFSASVYLVQRQGGAVQALQEFPIDVRLSNAVVVWVLYAVKTVWPAGLAVFYPHPQATLSMAQVVGAAALLVAISAVTLAQARRRPYLAVGWAWYLGTLVPVIGLVQVGVQQMADRYTYLPIVGLFIAATWLAMDVAPAGVWRDRVLPGLAVAVVVAFGCAAWVQVGYWKNTETLFDRALAVTRDNVLAHYNLALYLGKNGRNAEALAHLEQAVAIDPDYAEAESNLGSALRLQGRSDEAITHFERALALDPGLFAAHMNLGIILQEQGRSTEAIARFEAALEIASDNAQVRETLVAARRGLGRSLAREGRLAEATEHFREVERLEPADWQANYDLAVVLLLRGSLDEARVHYERALERRPDFAEAHNELGLLLLRLGQRELAAQHFREALRIQPGLASARENLRRLGPVP